MYKLSILIFMVVFYLLTCLVILFMNKKRTGEWKIWKTNVTVVFSMASSLCMILFYGLVVFKFNSLWLLFPLLFLNIILIAIGAFFALRKSKTNRVLKKLKG